MNTHKKIVQWCHAERWNMAAAACGAICAVAFQTHDDLGAYLQRQLLAMRTPLFEQQSGGMSPAPVSTAAPRHTASRRSAAWLLQHGTLHPSAPEPSAMRVTHRTAPPRTAVRQKPLLAFNEKEAGPSAEAPPEQTAAPEHSSAPAISPEASLAAFPPMVRTVFPLASAVNWGAMDRPEQWNRTYAQMTPSDFAPIPAYDLSKLRIPMQSLIQPRNVEEITRKLFYSTRFFGAYDLDSGEWVAPHPAIDLKAPIGMPVLAAAGGRVYAVRHSAVLGIHVIIEHRHPVDGLFYTIYGHLGSTTVREGEDVAPGQKIGEIGMTGNTSGPHVHFQVDLPDGSEPHQVYLPDSVPSPGEAARHVIHPILFLQRYADGVR